MGKKSALRRRIDPNKSVNKSSRQPWDVSFPALVGDARFMLDSRLTWWLVPPERSVEEEAGEFSFDRTVRSNSSS